MYQEHWLLLLLCEFCYQDCDINQISSRNTNYVVFAGITLKLESVLKNVKSKKIDPIQKTLQFMGFPGQLLNRRTLKFEWLKMIFKGILIIID